MADNKRTGAKPLPSPPKKKPLPKSVVRSFAYQFFKGTTTLEEPEPASPEAVLLGLAAPVSPSPNRPAPLPIPPVRTPVHIEIIPYQEAARKLWIWARHFWWIYTAAALILSLHFSLNLFQNELWVQDLESWHEIRQEQLSILRQSLNERKREARKLVNQMRATEREKALLAENLQFLAEGRGTARKKASVMTELGRVVPKGIRLLGLAMDETRVRMMGYTANRALIARFVRTLGRSHPFKSPQLVSVEAYENLPGIFSFEVWG